MFREHYAITDITDIIWISQSKNGNMYLIMKKRDHLVSVGKEYFCKKIRDITTNVFRWHSSNGRFLLDELF